MMRRAVADLASPNKSTRRCAVRWVLSTDFDPWAAVLGHEPGAMRRKLFTAAGLPLALSAPALVDRQANLLGGQRLE
jgi:hypothetical protein